MAVTTAIIAGTIAATQWAIRMSDAARSARLLSDGIAGSVAGGRELDAAIHALGAKVPQTSDELRSMAADLAKTGLRGKELTDALEDAAVKAAKLKWGPDFAKQTLSLDSQARRLQENIAGLFGGLNLEKFLGELAKIVGLFDSTSETGRAIKVVFESLFQPLVDGLAFLAPKIVSTFIQFEIWVLRALIAIKPFGSKILLAGQIVGGVALVIVGAFALVIGAAVAIGVAVTAVTAGIIYLAFKLTELVAGAIVFAATLISEPGKALEWLKTKFFEVVEWLRGISLAEIGKQMLDGLVQGITGGAAGVLSAITGAVGGAIDGAKKLLRIGSPSKVFAEIGLNTAAGMVQGVEGASGDVQGSIEQMVSPPDAAPAGGSSSSSSTSGHNLAGSTFQFFGVKDAEHARDLILELLEGDAVQLGLAPAPGGA